MGDAKLELALRLRMSSGIRSRMLHGNWTGENRAAMEEMLGYPYPETPIAVFDWDNTCIAGDIGDAGFHVRAERLQFDFESTLFWEWMDETTQGDRVRAAYQEYARCPTAPNAARLRYVMEWVRVWCWAELDDIQCCAWDTGRYIGWTRDQVHVFATEVIKEEMARPVGVQVLTNEGDKPLEIARGIRLRPEMKELMEVMRRLGWEVWVLSASSRWEVEVFASMYGVPPERVVAMQRRVNGSGTITAEVIPPLSYDAGKLTAYREYISRTQRPTFFAGDSDADWPMFDFARGVRLLVDPRNERLIDYARWRRSLGEPWLIQEFDPDRDTANGAFQWTQ